MYTLVFGHKIEADLKESYEYYNEQISGLGIEFLLSVDATFNQIERNPFLFQKVYKNKRRANLKRFPLGVFYTIYKETIVISAVIHLMRNPKDWKSRKA